MPSHLTSHGIRRECPLTWTPGVRQSIFTDLDITH